MIEIFLWVFGATTATGIATAYYIGWKCNCEDKEGEEQHESDAHYHKTKDI